MGRNRKRKYKYTQDELLEDETKVPIPNLPEKYLKLQVKSGTKMRNILKYALKEFSNHENCLWVGVNEGIEKTISCVEIFKRQNADLHQITKLRYVKSQKDSTVNSETTTKRVPEINIFLSKEPIVYEIEKKRKKIVDETEQ